VDWVHLTSDRD